MDHLRREKRISHIPLEESEDLLKDEGLLEESYIWETEKIKVHQALKKLKSEYRQVLYLKYFEEFSNEQAAKIMRKTKHQIENLVYRARQSLKAELEKEGFVYEKL